MKVVYYGTHIGTKVVFRSCIIPYKTPYRYDTMLVSIFYRDDDIFQLKWLVSF